MKGFAVLLLVAALAFGTVGLLENIASTACDTEAACKDEANDDEPWWVAAGIGATFAALTYGASGRNKS